MTSDGPINGSTRRTSILSAVNAAGEVSAGGVSGGRLAVLGGWPRRRWVVAAVASVVATVVFAVTGPGVGAGGGHGWWDWPVVVLDGGLAALVLASYVPAGGAGRLVELGCRPCALAGAAAVVLAVLFRAGDPAQVSRALLSVALLVFGLQHRLTGSLACATGGPSRPEGGGPGE